MENSGNNEENISYWQTIKRAYEELVMTVIRPMRALYSEEDLGPTPCLIREKPYIRTDIKLKNAKNLTLECSWWKPMNDIELNPMNENSTTQQQKKLPCIIALHGNSSCRLGCIEMMTYALEAGFTVFAFDFSGSGLSEGEYVSLGYHESNDIDTVMTFLRKQTDVSSIVLWGRSMGAVAALMFAEHDPGISAMVLDSPFAKLSRLALDLVDEGKLNVPKVAVSLVMRMVRSSIRKRADFDMFKLKPIENIDKCSIPCYFGYGKQDELIPPNHCQNLFSKHKGPKQIFPFEGGHNTQRPPHFFRTALQFLRTIIGLPEIPVSNSYNRTKESHSPSRSLPSQRSPPRNRNPLANGVSIESVQFMTVRELRESCHRAGYGNITCIEKKELIDLVIKLYERYSKMHPLETRQLEEKHEPQEALELSPPTLSEVLKPDNIDLEDRYASENRLIANTH